jgi:hypothetical protein
MAALPDVPDAAFLIDALLASRIIWLCKLLLLCNINPLLSNQEIREQVPSIGPTRRTLRFPERVGVLRLLSSISAGLPGFRKTPVQGKTKNQGGVLSLRWAERPLNSGNASGPGELSGFIVMRVVLRAFALVRRQCPRFTQGRWPGSLLVVVRQRLSARKPLVSPGKIATLEQHGSNTSQGLNAVRISVPGALIASCSHYMWSRTCARARQSRPDLLVFLAQTKGAKL